MPEPDAASLTLTDLYIMLAVRNAGPEITITGAYEYMSVIIGSRAVFPSLHRSITRLTERGCFTTGRSAPAPVRGGKARNLYSLTDAGTAALEASLAALDALRAGTEYEYRPRAKAHRR